MKPANRLDERPWARGIRYCSMAAVSRQKPTPAKRHKRQ